MDNNTIDDTLWKNIPDFDNYQAHPNGLVRNKKTKRIFNTECIKHKYISLKLNNKMYSLHRLIAKTFLENPHNLPFVNHKDRDTRNNLLSNLEYVTSSDNVERA